MSRPAGGTAPLPAADVGADGGRDAEQVVAVDGVSVRFGARQVLDHVSFDIRRGEFTGLIGSNGAGKTTLLRVILGLQRPQAGRVEFPGQHRSRGQRVGYVPQKVLLDPDTPMRARDVVALGLDGHRFGVPLRPGKRRDRVEEMLDAVDATRFADARVGRLSGGETQRVMIAHALVAQPQLLLLDEPLANLDLRSGGEIVALLARVSTTHGVGVLLSAHDINPLLPAMDRVVYIADGRAVAGTTDDVVRTETLSSLYQHHVEVLHVNGRIVVVAGDGPAAVEP